ncbi:Ycf66 family protein [Okeania sp. SIO3B5]|uniref:Ycf66 family protein n=1 Tax=Okeania sp. SIO3B5 TaxID=2607811 RepID=UPI0025FFA1BE|nr:Ycf66 family protein [Okeania sp. SIO3B5]
MLTKILALAVGLGSLALYLVAFFFPEVHRKNDFIWSGVGLFYGLILWFCAGRITGAVLLGQVASVALLGWFGWQTLTLRRQVTPVAEQTKISTQKSNKDKTQEQPTTIPQASSEEVDTIQKSDITEIASSIQEEENEVKPAEIKSELASSETILDSSNVTQDSEVDAATNMAEQNVITDTNMTEENVITDTTKDFSETPQNLQKSSSKKGGGFSQLLTPVSGLLSNIKNAIKGKDSKDTDTSSELVSKENQVETEELVSSEEVTSEVNDLVGDGKENSSEPEFLAEKEAPLVSDVQKETTLEEVEEESTLSSDIKATSTDDEKTILETNAESIETQDSPVSSDKITTQDSEKSEAKDTPISSEEKSENKNLESDLSTDSTNKSVDS